MEIINQNGKIYLQFLSKSKIIKKSLKLSDTKENLNYAQKTLLPIFERLYEANLSHTLLKKQKITKNKYLEKLKNENEKKLKIFDFSNKNLNFTFNKNITYSYYKDINNIKSNILFVKFIKKSKKSILLSQIFQEILNNFNINSKKTTLFSVKYVYEKILKILPDKNINLYSQNDIQIAIFRLKNENLSVGTLNLILTYLKYAFSYAKSKNLINKIPKIRKEKMQFRIKFPFNKNEIGTILKNAKNELKIYLYIAFFTGARSGEILALKKSDFFKQILNVNKNQTRFELTSPKNGTSRTILFPKKLTNFLNPIFKNLSPNEKIFKSDYFHMLYEFKKLLKSLNLPIFGLHITRHTYTSLLVKNLISPQFIAKNLGHSSLKLINRVYSHYIFDDEEIKKLNKIINF